MWGVEWGSQMISKQITFHMEGQDKYFSGNTYCLILTMIILYLRLWHSAKCFRSSAVDKRLCDICSVLSLGMAPAVMQRKERELEFCNLMIWTTRTYIQCRIWLISNPAVAFTISDEMGMFGSIMQLHKTVKKKLLCSRLYNFPDFHWSENYLYSSGCYYLKLKVKTN